ncbi:hypothetical protein PQO03_09505 [Lentisphaera profundi]|uniref:Uncharacterized protein n=1 Tax=Lentisphaera profundi TaxID=1658616 RepID=A0ABY7VRT6_9BACT|nr:hypothetical protein [Lentisphaera profundi]WDE95950.1 hypothetical protein PQO03_09505 [Lentisphaera profundi]
MKKLFTLLFIGALFFNQNFLQKKQSEQEMVILNEDLPPSLAFTSIALGPLKGIITSGLLWRAMEKEDKKEYMESYQLSRMITAIQPRYPSIWTFQGFTLSFNVAASYTRPDERWQWILRGIELMRDEGLKYNPDNAEIRHEIMRTIKDKIQQTDQEAMFMKNEWTKLMLSYFDDGDYAELQRLRKAAPNLEELKQRPYLKDLALVAKSNGIDLYDFKENPPQLNSNYIGYLFGGKFPSENQLVAVQAAVINLYFHDKRLRIEQDLNFDIKRMIQVDETYGPFDWRSHIATALYWGAEKDLENYTTGGLNYTRMTLGLMQDNFYEGKIIYNKSTDSFIRTTHVQALPSVHHFYDELLAVDSSRRNKKAHDYFIERAAIICYNMNQTQAAKELFSIYKYASGQKDATFEEFILGSMINTLRSSTVKETKSLIESLLISSYKAAEALNHEMSMGSRNRAMMMYRIYQKQYSKSSKRLPKFGELDQSAKKNLYGGNKKKLNNLELLFKTSQSIKAPKVSTDCALPTAE